MRLAATSKFPVIDRKNVFAGNGVFSPETRARAFAEAAQKSILEIDQANDSAVGHDVSYRTFVDGRETTNLYSATDSSTIAARWELGEGVVAYIADLLHQAGPVKTGAYRKSMVMYADGKEIAAPAQVAGALSGGPDLHAMRGPDRGREAARQDFLRGLREDQSTRIREALQAQAGRGEALFAH